MPLPIILGVVAGAAALGGVGAGIHGGAKMKEANDTMDAAKEIQEKAVEKFEKKNTTATNVMDYLGTKELNILNSFEEFSGLIEKIQGRPEFKEINTKGVQLPQYDAEQLKEVSVGAGLLIGGLGGAAAGTAGGFAAAGATTSAVMALGTASTGTAIASLSGAAATNATLAALGGGALGSSALAGGMALGTTILGATTLGIGLLVGGVIFNVTGSKLSDKADEAYRQANKTKKEVDKICAYLTKLEKHGREYTKSLSSVEAAYLERLRKMDKLINKENKVAWAEYTSEEKTTIQNAVLLVGMLFKMCKVQLVLKDEGGDGQNTINVKEIMDTEAEAETLLTQVA
jgi:hypothetical protein